MALEGLRPEREVRFTDPKHRLVTTRRVLKSDVDHDLDALLQEHSDLDALSDALVKEDPEIDIERFGAFLQQVSRVYVTEDGIIHGVDEFEVITNPDGSLRERRQRQKERQNINSDIPLRWSGKFIKKKDAIKKFVFINKQQLVHVNGLTFDFLYEIAKELEEKESLMLLRGGEKGNEPIILHRGGRPYNAFLEGRVKGDSYCLIIHFSNLELKKPKPIEGEIGKEAADEKLEPVEIKEKDEKPAKANEAEKEEKPKKATAEKDKKPEKKAEAKKAPAKKTAEKKTAANKDDDKKPAKKAAAKKPAAKMKS